MPITRTSMIDDDGSGTTGTIINNAWKQEFYGQIDAFADGVWVDIPYNATNYTVAAGTGTWTVTAGNQTTLAKVLLNQRTMVVAFYIQATVTTGSITKLGITVPGLVAAKIVSGTFAYHGSSGVGTGFVQSSIVQLDRLELLRDIGGTPWPATTSLYVDGQLIVAV
jgi:hypothetical protein